MKIVRWTTAICGQILLSFGIGLWSYASNGTLLSFFTGWFVSGGIFTIINAIILANYSCYDSNYIND